MQKNIILSFVSAISKILGGIGLLALLARTFTLNDFGEFTYAFTFGTVMSLLVDFGFNIKLLRDIAEKEEKAPEIIGAVLIIKSIVFIIVGFLFYLFSITLINNSNFPSHTIVVLFLAFCSYSFTNVFLSVFKARGSYGVDAIIVFIDSLITLLLVTFVSYFSEDILLTSITLLLTKLLTLVLAAFIYHKQEKEIKFPEFYLIKTEIKLAFPFAIHYLIGNLYLNIDTLIINDWVTNEELGIYQSGIRIIVGSGILLTIINSIYLPALTKLSKNPSTAFHNEAKALNGKLMLLGVVVVVLLNTFSELIISVVYGAKFLPLDSIFWIISLIIFLRIIGAPYGIFLTISNRQYLRAFAGFLSLIAIVLLDFLLVPTYGIVAAAYVLLIGHILINAIYYAFCFVDNKTLFLPTLRQLFILKLK